jgi:hypothetical protein
MITLEHRKVNIALPSEIWEILDGTDKMARKDLGQSFEEWVAALIMKSVAQCLGLALDAIQSAPTHGVEGNA